MEDSIIIGIDLSKGNVNNVMTVGRIRNDQSIEIINVFQGDEPGELYEKLTANKSSLTMKE